MKTKIDEKVESLTPERIKDYMIDNGWVGNECYGDKVWRWYRLEDVYEYVEIIQPIKPYCTNYNGLVDLLLENLSEFESRPVFEILKDIGG